jgi:hypothetical protein
MDETYVGGKFRTGGQAVKPEESAPRIALTRPQTRQPSYPSFSVADAFGLGVLNGEY